MSIYFISDDERKFENEPEHLVCGVQIENLSKVTRQYSDGWAGDSGYLFCLINPDPWNLGLFVIDSVWYYLLYVIANMIWLRDVWSALIKVVGNIFIKVNVL